MINERKKQEIHAGIDFLKGVRGFAIGLLFSRISYVLFDFYYTKFDMDLYYLSPNVWFWKIGGIFLCLGVAYITYIFDIRVLKNKYKGIFAYFSIMGGIIIAVWPVNSLDDFMIATNLGIIPAIGVLIIPGIIFGIARNSSGQIRKVSYLLIFAVLMYFIGTVIVHPDIIIYANESTGKETEVYFYLIQAILKSIGLLLAIYGSGKFMRL